MHSTVRFTHLGTCSNSLKSYILRVPAAGTLLIVCRNGRIVFVHTWLVMAGDTLRSLERGLKVLDTLGVSSGMTLRELHCNTSLPKPTLLRILSTLEARGYVQRRIADGVWRRCAGRNISGSMQGLLLDVGSNVLDDLCQRLLWPSDIAVYDDSSMMIIETTRKKTPYGINWTGVGYRIPVLQTGLGRAWLAFCNDEERDAIVSDLRRSQSPFDRPAKSERLIEQIVQETRKQGYGTRVPGFTLRKIGEEKTDGFAVPVLAGDKIVGCLNITWLASALDLRSAVTRYLPELKIAAASMGERIHSQLSLDVANLPH